MPQSDTQQTRAICRATFLLNTVACLPSSGPTFEESSRATKLLVRKHLCSSVLWQILAALWNQSSWSFVFVSMNFSYAMLLVSADFRRIFAPTSKLAKTLTLTIIWRQSQWRQSTTHNVIVCDTRSHVCWHLPLQQESCSTLLRDWHEPQQW